MKLFHNIQRQRRIGKGATLPQKNTIPLVIMVLRDNVLKTK